MRVTSKLCTFIMNGRPARAISTVEASPEHARSTRGCGCVYTLGRSSGRRWQRLRPLLRDRLDALGARIPTLYKQYTDLCEPGGTRFLSFGVDPAFANSIDGLILVDLAMLKAKKRSRYLGRFLGEAAAGRAGPARGTPLQVLRAG